MRSSTTLPEGERHEPQFTETAPRSDRARRTGLYQHVRVDGPRAVGRERPGLTWLLDHASYGVIMLKPMKRQRAFAVTTIVITTIAVLSSVENTLAEGPQRMSVAPTSQLTGARLNVLENAFWVCDYLATTRGATDISTCAAIYEEIKDRKFAGDFEALLSWWRQNKVAQHQIIAVSDSPNSVNN